MNSMKQMNYQGHKRKAYFEGWYYKLMTTNGTIISIIPGISKTVHDPHAFIQIINNHNHETHYIRFESTSFIVQENPFCVQIGANRFETSRISLNIDDECILKGVVDFGLLTPIDQSLYSPNIMGPFAYVPQMECVHGIISLRHSLEGSLLLNDEWLDFNGGLGYLEKDYGTSFPSEYIWIQCHHQNHGLFFSHAKIPMKGFTFDGLISILEVNGKQHRFATYNGAKVIKQIKDDDSLIIHIKKGKSLLKLCLTHHLSFPLVAPKKGTMSGTIYESLDGHLHVVFEVHKQVVFEETFKYVASEIAWRFNN